ncbi:MAG: endonuclease Q family protein [Elusimicrobiota bacterium]|jgi:uncharacterized protein (TIGR00375 family)
MEFLADLHIHSRYSRACSASLCPEELHRWGLLKGLRVLATGDFTHPAWLAELEEKLTPAEEGLLRLKPELAAAVDARIPASCRGQVRFLLGTEISCIYKRGGKVRKVHNLVYVPSFAAARKLRARLEKIGNLRSDGRPILGLDSRDLLELVLDSDPRSYLVPAHAWTPHFAVFGSASGFDALEDCFGDLTQHIFSLETGLSSDPEMNWRLSALDDLSLISNSDAHSPEKLGREANIFDTELSYDGIFEPLKKKDLSRFFGTLEFFPEQGKYHVDGHRNCQVRMDPAETLRRKGLCTSCGKPVTVGVLHRVEKLADRPLGNRPASAPGFEKLVPLKDILSQALQVGPSSKKVAALYTRMLERFGPELDILRKLDMKVLESEGYALPALAIGRMRAGRASMAPGYDGEFGTVSLLSEPDFADTKRIPA